MTPFQEALDHVHATLQSLQAQGVPLFASRAALERLVATPTALFVAQETAVAAPVEDPPEVSPHPVIARTPAPIPVAFSEPDSTLSKADQLAAMRPPTLACIKCPHLAATRTQVVFGVGNPEAELMFVGEAPGADEDLRGEPFVGRAGELLTKIISAMGFTRDEIYIANVLKCRPDMPAGVPGNRAPTAEEMQTCLPYLQQQIHIIQPRAIVGLGSTAIQGLTGNTAPIGKLRGKWQDFGGIPLMATYHPAYLLRSGAMSEKRKVWEDLMLVLEKLGKPISEKQRGFFLPK